jgi:hypothetical protein
MILFSDLDQPSTEEIPDSGVSPHYTALEVASAIQLFAFEIEVASDGQPDPLFRKPRICSSPPTNYYFL